MPGLDTTSRVKLGGGYEEVGLLDALDGQPPVGTGPAYVFCGGPR
jgi:hypothetical protein